MCLVVVYAPGQSGRTDKLKRAERTNGLLRLTSLVVQVAHRAASIEFMFLFQVISICSSHS
jgi:hypothetical protein